MLTDDRITIGFLLYDLSRGMRYAFDSRARSLGVTRQQWRVLLSLARCNGITQTELADRLDVERITVGRMVDRLVENGLVERRADPLDRRVWRLHLLPAAHDIVSHLTSIAAELERDALAHIPAERRSDLFELLEMLRDGVKSLRDFPESPKEVA